MFPLPESITVWRPIGDDGLGGVTWSDPAIHPARTAFSQREFTDLNGDRKISTAVAYTQGDAQISDYVLFGASAAVSPPPAARDVRATSQTPSGAGDLKKLWFS